MKRLIVIGSVLFIALTCGGVLVYTHLLSPNVRSRSLAETYMHALVSDDSQKATGLYSGQDVSSIMQRNYQFDADTFDGGVYYFLYHFSDKNNPSQIRIATTPDKIQSIATGSKLGKLPRDDKKESTNTQTAQLCLDRADLKYIDSISIYASTIRGATMIFLPNSADYKTSTGGGLLLDRMANFYKQSSNKDYVFELRGYRQAVKITDDQKESLDNLYQQRVTKLQRDLVGRGVPLDRVTINSQPNYYTSDQTTDLSNELYIDINIVNRCIKQ